MNLQKNVMRAGNVQEIEIEPSHQLDSQNYPNLLRKHQATNVAKINKGLFATYCDGLFLLKVI
ncbi:MAG TPA: hypothetical protein VGO63_01200 [Candidatus Paceibacterota bacterium]|nr:hypothetical protein [Candidatus Paceibacterota bacterium]